MSIDTHHASPSRAIIGPTPATICPDTLALLPSLTEDAGSGHVQGLAVVALRDGVAHHLKVRESGREEGNPHGRGRHAHHPATIQLGGPFR